MKVVKTLKGRLFFWYLTSLVTVTAYFYLAIHIFKLPYGNILFFILLSILALEGFFIVRRLTNALFLLSSKIKSITTSNLNKKLKGIESGDEIGEMADSFNELLDRLDEAFKHERQFIGDVAHELKTPLSGLRASLELILFKERSKEEYKNAIREALLDTDKISKTLKDILDLAWSQAKDAQKNQETVNLSDVVSEIKEIALKLGFRKYIAVNTSIKKQIFVYGHRDRIFRAFLNIVDNAVKFTPKKGTIDIDLSKTNGRAVFRVLDTGAGIAKEDLPHLFKRYFRGSKTKKTHGLGVGLAISYAIIKAHQGDVKIKSKVGRGTKVSAVLPIFP